MKKIAFPRLLWPCVLLCGPFLATPSRAADKVFAPTAAATVSGTFSAGSTWKDGTTQNFTTAPTAADNALFNGFSGQENTTVNFTAAAVSTSVDMLGTVTFNLAGRSYIASGVTFIESKDAVSPTTFYINGGTFSTSVLRTLATASSRTTVASNASLYLTNQSANLYSLLLRNNAQLIVNGTLGNDGGIIGVGVDGGSNTLTVTGSTASAEIHQLIVGTDSDDADTIGGTGTVNVSNGAQMLISANAVVTSPYVSIGSGGTGTVNVTSGGRFTMQTSLYVGETAGNTGAINVSGANSQLDVVDSINGDGFLAVGYAGQGTLTVSGGGRMRTDSLSLGRLSTGVGTVTVDGANSQINITDSTNTGFRVGRDGSGDLIVRNGGKVTAHYMEVGLSVAVGLTITLTYQYDSY